MTDDGMEINSKLHSKKHIFVDTFQSMGGGFNLKITDDRGGMQSISLTLEEAKTMTEYMAQSFAKKAPDHD